MSIDDLRAKIDDLDAQVLELLSRRARVAMEIGALKLNGPQAAIYAPDREEQILRRLAELNRGPLRLDSLRAIYVEIMSACRAVERRLRVAFLGPEGTFAHQAVKRQFGASADAEPLNSIAEVFAEVERRRADYGVVPIENSSEGGVGETLDALMEYDLNICAEIQLRIHHSLLAKTKQTPIKRVYSKGLVFGQCRRWLAEHFPRAERVDMPSTSQAAERAAAEPESAAIAHEDNAGLYGLEIIERNIEDNPRNATRFFVIGGSPGKPTGKDKTSLLCFIKDEVGALLNILRPFSEGGLNLTKIESWPSKRRVWDYCFFIDFEGHANEEPVKRAIAEVGGHCSQMKLLGSYPRAGD